MTQKEKNALYESILQKAAVEVKKMILEAAAKENKKIVVFTGKSKYFEGDKVEKFIEDNTDYKTSHTVNNKTDLLVTGYKPGPNKLAKAEELGITVMKEDAFWAAEGLTDELPEELD
jgi:DNA ligase (NAD+)